MAEVLATDTFRDWYLGLSDSEADGVTVSIERLELLGIALPFPHSSEIKGSRYPLRELRVTAGRSPLRVFYAFDPQRDALLLIGGSKAGTKRFYEKHVPRAEKLWEDHLSKLEELS